MINRALTDRFTFAFQPIVDVTDSSRAYAYEALVRGVNGEAAELVLASVPIEDRLLFDAACRQKAVEMAVVLGIEGKLSVNIVADAICHPRYGLHGTLRAARRVGWPAERLIFEMTEHVPVSNPTRLMRWIASARKWGLTVAIDDFGSGYATINSLLRLRPCMIKLDMDLIRDIDMDPSRQSIVKGIIDSCATFDCVVVAEGVETRGEYDVLRRFGVRLMQGFLFAKPAFESLPIIDPQIFLWPAQILDPDGPSSRPIECSGQKMDSIS